MRVRAFRHSPRPSFAEPPRRLNDWLNAHRAEIGRKLRRRFVHDARIIASDLPGC
jgi:hypothetical protein